LCTCLSIPKIKIKYKVNIDKDNFYTSMY
jgi:hypothetical protein